MYLSNIKLWNFRKFGSDLPFDLEKPNLDLNFTKGLNVLIGENDSGKSAIMDAIKLTLKTHSYDWLKITHDDFYLEESRLRIELKFEDLSDNEAKNFTEWLGWTGEGEEVKPFLRLIYNFNRNLNDFYIQPSEVRAGVDESGYQLTAEAREYLKTTYLKPLRDAKSELIPRKNSRLAQILQGHEAFKGKNEDHLLVEHFRNFNSSVENYFTGKDNNGADLTDEGLKGKELKDEIDKFIKAFYSKDKESNFGIVGSALKNILEKLELSIKDEINPGLGTLNRLFMASELLHLQKKDWSGLRLGLIEELEAHLHPQAQMQIIEALQKEENIQLILATHSPNLGSKLKLENLILCTNDYAYPLGPDYTQLEPSDYAFLERFLDATKANLFFAKGVIFVEGWAEEILLPSFTKKLKKQGLITKDLTEAGVSIVNIGSTAFLRYSRIFLRKEEDTQLLDTPISIITDVDIRDYEKDANSDEYVKRDTATVIAESEEEKLKIIGNWQKQTVKVFVANNWTLEYALFKSTSLGTKFNKIFKNVHPRIDETKIEEELAKKLIKKLKKTEIAYQLAQEIESDEEIEISEDDESIKYLIDAIKNVCND
jgi:putative ATP-dependent endonuclease of the OLD family